MISNLAKDIRFALRMLRKSPGFTAVAIITLALCIGANAVVFGILNALVLRPMNLPRYESLHGIDKNGWMFLSYPNYLDVRDRNRSFEDLAAYAMVTGAIDADSKPLPVWGYAVSGNYFTVLGVQPYLGRFIQASDEQGSDSAPYIVLTHAYWQSHFHGDRSVVGRIVRVNKHPFTVVGVTPPEFRGSLLFFVPSFFVPMVNAEQLTGVNILNDRRNYYGVMGTVGHLKPGVTTKQATADLNAIGSWLLQTYPEDNTAGQFSLNRPALSSLGGPITAFVAGLMLLAALILLAGCSNLGSLFAARAADRSREVALRMALGASRGRIVQQLLTEAVLISMAGGALGLVASSALLRGLASWQPFARFPILQIPLSPDANVYLVALLLAVASGFLFGSVPVRQVLRADPYQIVKSGSLTKAGRRITLRDTLLVTQVAICAVLVTSSLVAVRGLLKSLHSNFGFEPTNAMLIEADLGMADYRGDRIPEVQKRILDEMQSIPGVDAAGIATDVPLSLGPAIVGVFKEQQTDLKPANAAATAVLYSVSTGYFRAAGTTLIAGRPFTEHDDKNAPRVAIINPEFARKTFGLGESFGNALGRRFKVLDGTLVEVTGIAEDGKYFNIADPPRAAMFLPILQSPMPLPETFVIVRSERDPQDLASAIESGRRKVDASLPFRVQTWTSEIQLNLFPSRAAASALGLLGIMAALLSVTGVFGMAAYSVSKRMKELGIRIALGAHRKEVLQAALGRAFKVLAIGSTTGLILGILGSQVLAAIVYQATPRDPIVLGAVVLAMFSLGLLATWIPARRALSIDPLDLLREE